MTAVITRPKATAEYAQWMHALRLAKHTIGKRVALPVLACMLLEADDDQCGVTAKVSNLEQSVVIGMRGHFLECRGKLLLPVNAAWDVIRALSAGISNKRIVASEPISVVDGEYHVTVCGFGREMKIEKLGRCAIDDYPAVPTQNAPMFARVDAKQLHTAWKFVALSAGVDDTLPMLTGVRVEFDCTNVMTLAATNRYTLAVLDTTVKRMPARKDGEATFLVPAGITRQLGLLEGVVSIRLHPKLGLVMFQTDSATLTSRLLDAAFPAYRSLVPDSDDLHWFHVPRKAMSGDVTAAAASKGRNEPVKVFIGPHGFTVEGCASHTITSPSTEAFATAFNPQFLRDCLDSFTGDSVRMGGSAPAKPWLFEGDLMEHTHARRLIMPVRLPG